jgi:hypothetical protein
MLAIVSLKLKPNQLIFVSAMASGTQDWWTLAILLDREIEYYYGGSWSGPDLAIDLFMIMCQLLFPDVVDYVFDQEIAASYKA